MPASFTIQFQAGDVIRTLQVVEAAYRDPSDLMADTLLLMIRSTQLNFEAQGRPTRWAGLAESTIQRRLSKTKKGAAKVKALKTAAKKGFGPKLFKAAETYIAAGHALQILRDTGLLLQSVGGGASGPFETPDGFGESDDLTATIGTNHPGAYNQFPDTRTNRPERIIFIFQEQDVEDVTQMAADWFLRVGPYAL